MWLNCQIASTGCGEGQGGGRKPQAAQAYGAAGAAFFALANPKNTKLFKSLQN
jgi:hypothetical protein